VITRYDHRTGMTRQITPWPRNTMGWAAKDLKYRFQWTAPIMVSRHDPHALYFAGDVLFESTNQGQSWRVISPDLTRNDKSRQESSGGPLTKDNTSVEYYDTIFAVSESPVAKGLIWVGSDDGLVHLSQDEGGHWADVTPKAMPEWATVDAIEPDPHDPATAYVAADRHRLDDARPYAFVTHDSGKTWSEITSGIPADAYVHVVRADPVRKGLLYAGTEKGVFVSYDDGGRWEPLQLNLPVAPVHDIAVHGDSLALATHGRAFWVLDDLTPIRAWSEGAVREKTHLFAPAPTARTTFFTRPGGGREASAANPPGGAAITYWLSPAFGTARPAEDAKEEPGKKGAPDPLEARIKLEILDADGHVIRSFPETSPKPEPKAPAKGPAAKDVQAEADAGDEGEDRGPRPQKVPHLAGFNTLVWDLHYGPAVAIPHAPLWAGSVTGPKALPGRYQARLTVDGVSQTQPLEILPDPRGTATPEQLKKQFDLHLAINAELSSVDQAVLDLRAARARVEAAVAAGAGKSDAARVKAQGEALAARMSAVEEALIQPRAHASEDALNFPVRLNNMLAALGSLTAEGDAAPTDQDVAMFTELKGECDQQLAEWAKIQSELARFEASAGL